MSLADKVLEVNNDLPIRTDEPVHSGKVRSVYWLTKEDSARLIEERNYPVAKDVPLAIMVISDRISAFECIWKGEGGMRGVPGKGASLNAISNHWFRLFREKGLADSHILEIPHPLVWIVQKARPVMIEAIARQYITGSMWAPMRRENAISAVFPSPTDSERIRSCPNCSSRRRLKESLKESPGVPEQDDVNVTRKDILDNFEAFRFRNKADIDVYEKLLSEGFSLISKSLAALDQVFVDTKFEFGYVTDKDGNEKLIYMDEVGTPDSSRIWDGPSYQEGKVVENSKRGSARHS